MEIYPKPPSITPAYSPDLPEPSLADQFGILSKDTTILTPNGVDDHDVIMSALSSSVTTIKFTKGTYKIFKPLILQQINNKKLIFDEGAEIYWEHGTTSTTDNTGYESMFRLRSCKNISIIGGNFYTDGIDFTITSDNSKSQWMHFFYCDDVFGPLCENITFDGCTGHDFPGDFFELYGGKNITIKNCNFDRCWRTGISPVKVEGLWIEDNVFTNCSLESTNSYPGAINFEADLTNHYMLKIYVRNNVFTSNTKCISLTPKCDQWGDIHIEGNTFTGRYWLRLGGSSIKTDFSDVFIHHNHFTATDSAALYQYPSTTLKNLKFSHCWFDQQGFCDMIYLSSYIDIEFFKCRFTNSGATNYPAEGIIRTDYNNTYRKMSFKQCTFVHNSTTTGMTKIFGLETNLELIDCDLSGLPSAPIMVQFETTNNSLKLREITWGTINVTVTGSTQAVPVDLYLYSASSNVSLSFDSSYVTMHGYLINTPIPVYPTPANYNLNGLDVVSAKYQNVSAKKTAAQTLTTATSTAINFDSTDFDTNTMHNNTTNNTRLTCKVAGTYSITAALAYATNATGIRGIAIKLNGSTVIAEQQVPTPGTGYAKLNVSVLYKLSVNDYVEVYGYQDSGAPLDITVGARNFLAMAKVG